MKYYFYNFFINDISKEKSYIMNTKSISTIDNQNLISMLHWVDQNNIDGVSVNDIKRFMGNKYKQTIDFLLNNSFVYIPKKEKSDYDNYVYITNDSSIYKVLSFNLIDDDNSNYKYKCYLFNDINSLNDFVFNKENLYCFILNPFDIKMIEYISKLSRKHHFNVRVAFSYNFKFYITNIYSPNNYSPCPMCFFYNLESSLRSTDRFTNKINFQNIVDIIYNNNANFISNVNYSRDKILHLISFLTELNNKNSYKEVYEININNTSVDKDIAYHWELCDCYE